MNTYLVKCLECEKIKGFVDDRLFELRQSPRMSPEKRSLSHIQLILHEASEVAFEITTGTTANEEVI